jgi:putative DNA primase/helicase
VKAPAGPVYTPIFPIPNDAPSPIFKGMDHGPWIYRNAEGQGLFYTYRRGEAKGMPLYFGVAKYPNGRTVRTWYSEGLDAAHFPSGKFPLYNLHSLTSQPDATVLVVEGEKCADKLADIFKPPLDLFPLVGLTWKGGARNVDKADLEPLRGRGKILLLPDNDAPGFQAMDRFATRLKNELGITAWICEPPPGKPEKWDIADATDEEARAFVESAKPWEPLAMNAVGEQPTRPAGLDDIGNGIRFTRHHGSEVRYVPALGWMVWNGKRWIQDGSCLNVQKRAKTTARRIYAEAAEEPDSNAREKIVKWARDTGMKRALESMLFAARSESGIPGEPEDFNRDPYLLCVENGEVDLRTGQLHPHRKQSMCSKITPVAYNPGAKSEVFNAFLKRIFDQDKELINYVQRMTGYSLSGSTNEQCFFIAYGEGANGKSTLVELLLHLLGDYGLKTTAETFLAKQGQGNASNDIARLVGRRMVAGVETGANRRLAATLIKELTGGDTISARFLYQEYFEFKPTFKIWIATNHKPRLEELGEAMMRRIKLVPFKVTVPPEERDSKLLDRLKTECAEAVLAWAVAGAVSWYKNGIGTCAAVTEATEEYRLEQDRIGRWIREECTLNPNARCESGRLWDEFERWAMAAGEAPGTRAEFTRYLTAMDLKPTRTNAARYWQGIDLIAAPDTRQRD